MRKRSLTVAPLKTFQASPARRSSEETRIVSILPLKRELCALRPLLPSWRRELYVGRQPTFPTEAGIRAHQGRDAR